MDSAQIMTGASDGNTEPAGGKRRGISGGTIKIIAVLFMLIDHAAASILTRELIRTGYMEIMERELLGEVMGWLADNVLLYLSYDGMRMVGRVSFPIFCFFVAEGFQKTKNVKKYLLRLGIFAFISEIPFDLAFYGRWFTWGHQNVFFTLFLGLLVLCCFKYFEEHVLPKALRIVLVGTGALLPAVYITTGLANVVGLREISSLLIACGILCIAIGVAYFAYGKSKGARCAEKLCGNITVLMLGMYLADLLRTDYSGMGVLVIVILYVLRKRRILAMSMGCLALTLMSFAEITAFGALIPIALYNGERGWKLKYFFYAFYPVHLLLLYLICIVMGISGIVVPM